MCHQEEHGYSCSDYLRQYNHVAPGPKKKIAVDGEVRAKLVEWCYSIVDFCKFNRETVAISISYLDRFLLSELGLVTLQEPTIYQLAAMTSLYTAIKIHEPEAMDPELVSNLSHGAYTIEQVEAMEYAILQAIDWRVNTPTALAFVRHFLDLLPNKVLDKATKAAAYDLAINQTEVAVREYKFVTVNASAVAYVSLMNSLESLCIDSKTYDYVCRVLSKVSNIDPGAKNVLEMHKYLYPHVSDHHHLSIEEMQRRAANHRAAKAEAAVAGMKSPKTQTAVAAAPKKALEQHRAAFFGLSPCSTFDSFPSRS
ncbi:diatom-specific cyclin [Seminavis robusta]|uniref:Diatom-specific cyclin n=1 Tax=Seminavis robusta TaxID=568900 RepID=A0A9N8E4X8_9STRA|nr:diatom-specific cyclin [Seminavis robusta]|eukprot:Sro672_g185130.1 diatom-specific cyclin (311) ;mRNA; r:47263-48195